MAAHDVQIHIIGRDLASPAFASVNASAQKTAQSINSTGSAFSTMNRIMTATVGTMAGLAGFSGLGSVFDSAIGASMKFAKTMEVTEVGLAGILLSMTQVDDRALSWGESIAMSKTVMKQLSDEALRTAATTEELTLAFQGILGPALNAKMTISEIVQLSSVGVNAVKTLLPGNADMQRQIVQELRDLVAGGIQTASSTLATALGLKDEDIKKAKESSEGLFKFLMDRMKGFETAAPAYARTWQGITEQLKEGVTRAGATGLEPLFAAAKEQTAQLAGYVTTVSQETGKIQINPAVIEGFRSIANSTLWIARHAGEITTIIAGWMIVGRVAAIYTDVAAAANGATAAQTLLGRAVLSMQTAHAQQIASAQAAAAAEISAAMGANAAILAAVEQQKAAKANTAVVAAGAASLEKANLFAAAAQLKGLQAEYIKLGATAEQAGIMQAQAAALAKEGNFLLALQLMATQEAHLKNAAAANAAGIATEGAMNKGKIAVGGLLSSVWSLIGGWFGVAAAVGVAIYKMRNYYAEKAEFDNDKPIIEKDAAGNEKYFKNIVMSQPIEVQGEGIVGYRPSVEKVELSEEEVRTYLQRRIDKRKAEMGWSDTGNIDDLMKQLQSKFPGDAGGASAANAIEKAYEERQRLLDKTADMIAKMNGKINAETSTAFEAASAKLTEEAENMRRELDKSKLDFEKYGIDVKSVYDKIGEYQSVLTAKIERQRLQSFYGVIADTSGIGAGISGNKALQAEAEYQKEMARIKTERENDDVFKNIGKNEEDIAARIAADQYYAALEAAALKKRNDQYRDFELEKYNIAVESNNLRMVLEGRTQSEIDTLNHQSLQKEKAYLEEKIKNTQEGTAERLRLEKELHGTILQMEDIEGRSLENAVAIANKRMERKYIDWAQEVQQSFESIHSSFENNLLNMLTGAESFSSGLKNIFRDMLNEISRMMIKTWYNNVLMKPVQGFINNLFGIALGGSGNAGINTSYNPSFSLSKPVYTTLGSINPAKFKFAQGGLASGWAIVGEEGPELVNFTQPGRVYTAPQTREALAGKNAGPMPAFADGGNYRGGWAIVGEEGPELINFTQPGYVHTATETKSILSEVQRQDHTGGATNNTVQNWFSSLVSPSTNAAGDAYTSNTASSILSSVVSAVTNNIGGSVNNQTETKGDTANNTVQNWFSSLFTRAGDAITNNSISNTASRTDVTAQSTGDIFNTITDAVAYANNITSTEKTTSSALSTMKSVYNDLFGDVSSSTKNIDSSVSNISGSIANTVNKELNAKTANSLLSSAKSVYNSVLGDTISNTVADQTDNRRTIWNNLISGARASGGAVSAGRLYQVNELGTELFVPNVNGYVMTASQTQQAMSASGGGSSEPANITVNIMNQTGVPANAEVRQSFDGDTAILTVVLNALSTNKMGYRDSVQAVAAKGAAYGY